MGIGGGVRGGVGRVGRAERPRLRMLLGQNVVNI